MYPAFRAVGDLGAAIWLSSPFLKNNSVFFRPKSSAYSRRPVPAEGRFAIVTNAERDAVDAGCVGYATRSQGRISIL
jgi:hypothetical protein